MTLFVEHESFSGASVSTQTFDLVSGNPGTGIYHAAGLALGGSTSAPGVVTYKIRLDPNAEGAVLVGTPGNAQVDVTIVAAPS